MVDAPQPRSPPAGPCSRCGRTLLELRSDLSIAQLRGSAPLCSVPGCPLVRRIQGFKPDWQVTGRELSGPSPPSVFVGRYGYPKVHVGPLFPPTAGARPDALANAALLDDPPAWLDRDIAEVLGLRQNLVRSKASVDVRKALDATRALDASRELAMSARPVDTEITLTKRSRFDPSRLEVDRETAPMGPSVTVEKARVTSNPSVPRRVDAAVADTDARAADVAWEMFDGGVSDYKVQQVLSVGLLGREGRRRLVPTRWSITATDDMLGKALIDQVKDWGPVGTVEHRSHVHFGNHFHVVLFPRVWSFEMLEAWERTADEAARGEAAADGSAGGHGAGRGWVTLRDAEGYDGRTAYADRITGAYYAARLGVLEHLRDRRRQAAALVYREITDAYFAPLGVWVIREGVRQAMRAKLTTFASVDEAVGHVRRQVRCGDWTRRTRLVDQLKTQTTLRDFA